MELPPPRGNPLRIRQRILTQAAVIGALVFTVAAAALVPALAAMAVAVAVVVVPVLVAMVVVVVVLVVPVLVVWALS